MKQINILAILTLTVLGAVKTSGAIDRNKLQIYMPRTANVTCQTVKLGDITVLSGDPNFAASASSVSLGRIAEPGEHIVIDFQTILSRLASNGIYSRDIKMSGADSITVTRQGCVVKGAQIREAAIAELEKQPKDHNWRVVGMPKEFAADGASSDIKLQARPGSSASQTRRSMIVSILVKGKEVATRQVDFEVFYNNHRAVAIADIATGTVISADNTRIETFDSVYAQQGWSEPFGLVARRQIRANTVVSADMIEAVQSPKLVTRNQGVVIQIKQPGLSITAMGEALQDGKAREFIKVRNIDSQRVLVARVNDDGTVEPTGSF